MNIVKAAFACTVGRFVLWRWLRRKERQHGFPCGICGAKTFDEAGDLCRGYYGCPGDDMSKDIFAPQNGKLTGQQKPGKGKAS